MRSSDAAPVVIHEMHMQVVCDDGTRVAMPATLSFTAAEPYAVTATFRAGESEHTWITWVFARDLLRDGMRDIAGYGDIVVRPSHPSRGAQVILTLSSPHGSAVIEGSRHQIAAFIEEAYAAVPDGAEWMYLNIDSTIADLLEA